MHVCASRHQSSKLWRAAWGCYVITSPFIMCFLRTSKQKRSTTNIPPCDLNWETLRPIQQRFNATVASDSGGRGGGQCHVICETKVSNPLQALDGMSSLSAVVLSRVDDIMQLWGIGGRGNTAGFIRYHRTYSIQMYSRDSSQSREWGNRTLPSLFIASNLLRMRRLDGDATPADTLPITRAIKAEAME